MHVNLPTFLFVYASGYDLPRVRHTGFRSKHQARREGTNGYNLGLLIATSSLHPTIFVSYISMGGHPFDNQSFLWYWDMLQEFSFLSTLFPKLSSSGDTAWDTSHSWSARFRDHTVHQNSTARHWKEIENHSKYR